MSLRENLKVLMKSKASQKDLIKQAKAFKIKHRRDPTEKEAEVIARYLVEKHTGKTIKELEEGLDKKEEGGKDEN